MIPVEVTQTPWHFTTWPDAFDHWQTIIAGVLALAAAVGTIVMTSRIANSQIVASREEADRVIAATRDQTAVAQKQIDTTVRLERERLSSELDALRKSLAVELRLQITRALSLYASLERLAKSNEIISSRMVESLLLTAAPIIYSANAHKIGFLEGEAMDVVLTYTLLETARGRVARLLTSPTPDQIDPHVLLITAEAFLEACRYARVVLPRLRTGIATHDATTEVLIQNINAAVSASTV
jgi:hypothetical protein